MFDQVAFRIEFEVVYQSNEFEASQSPKKRHVAVIFPFVLIHQGQQRWKLVFEREIKQTLGYFDNGPAPMPAAQSEIANTVRNPIGPNRIQEGAKRLGLSLALVQERFFPLSHPHLACRNDCLL